jgi:hypothetical protein
MSCLTQIQWGKIYSHENDFKKPNLELNLVCTPIHRPNSNPVPYYAVCLNRTSAPKQDMGLVKTALILKPFELKYI